MKDEARTTVRRCKLAMTLAAALTGGSMLSTCQTRIKDAVIDGSKDYLFNTLLNPMTIAGLISNDGDGTEEE
ncbi:MAG: hypothetical protein WBE26_10765 [Phycisphaerae bacterium]